MNSSGPAPSPAPAPGPGPVRAGSRAAPRLHHLDALRGFALLLGVLLHALMPFLGGGWLVDDSRSSALPLVAIYLIHLFRMVLFMMLAGFFGAMVLQRRGAVAYLRDRALRIALPLVVFWPVIAAGSVFAIVLNVASRGIDVEPMRPVDDSPALLAIPTFHLWFLLLLAEIIVVVLAVRGAALRVLGPQRAGRWSARIGAALSSRWGLLLAAVPYAAGIALQVLLEMPDPLTGLREPTALLPAPGASAAYLGAFATGWFLHASPGALERISRNLVPATVVAAAASAAGLLSALADEESLHPAVMCAMTALAGWGWTFMLLGLASRVVRREIAWVRYLADSSYWVYLLHFPLLLLLAVPLADLSWPWALKLLITLAATMLVLLLSYEVLVRGTWLGAWLNGRRRPQVLRLRRRAQRAAGPRAGTGGAIGS